MPQQAFFLRIGQPKNEAKTLFFFFFSLFFSPSIPFPRYFWQLQQYWHLYCFTISFSFHCYTQREATPTQKSARKSAATSRDFLRERLQSAFTLANQIQEPGETFQRFVTALKLLVKDCENGQAEDDIVRDRIVFGTKSAKVHEKLIDIGRGS